MRYQATDGQSQAFRELLRKEFQNIDTNKDNYLSYDELTRFLDKKVRTSFTIPLPNSYQKDS